MQILKISRIFVVESVRPISTTNILFAEPPKKKVRVDPAILRVRVERKLKRFEREIERIEREPRQRVPIPEYQLTRSNIKDLTSRPGRDFKDFDLAPGTIKAASQLWSIYRREQSTMEARSYRKVFNAQEHALQTLKEIDENLYEKSVEMDDLTLIPYISSHVRKEFPPNPDYSPPDGFIKDLTVPKIMADIPDDVLKKEYQARNPIFFKNKKK